jgi:hypothetical protein
VKITIGEWKTRDGRKAIVAAENKDAVPGDVFIGWVNEISCTWFEDGSYYGGEDPHEDDLIAPWTDPVPWDWSTTPPWINWIAMDENKDWWMYAAEPSAGPAAWLGGGCSRHLIPKSHAPKWHGDWRKSKTMRPGFNGGAK